MVRSPLRAGEQRTSTARSTEQEEKAVNVIPQSQPIKVHVTERSPDGKVLHQGTGRIVAWRVDLDGDQLEQLTPIIWTSGYTHAIPYDSAYTEVRYSDEWD